MTQRFRPDVHITKIMNPEMFTVVLFRLVLEKCVTLPQLDFISLSFV